MVLYVVIAAAILLALAVGANYNKNAIMKSNTGVISRKNVGDERLYFFVVLLFLWVLTAFRSSNIGNDTPTYLNYFTRINLWGINKDFAIEIGYQYYCLIIGKITTSGAGLLIITATICYLGVGIYVYKYSKNLMFSLVLLFCTCFSIFTNILRQSLAMVICLYAYQAIRHRKLITPIVLILLAYTFHKTALICFAFFLKGLCPKRMWFVAFVAIVLAVLSVSGMLSKILLKIIPEYAGYFSGKYVGSGRLAVTYSIVQSFVFCCVIYCANRKNGYCDKLVTTNFVGLLLLNCLAYSVNLFTRASTYFMLIGIVELPNALMALPKEERKFLTYVIGLVMVAMVFVSMIFRPEWNRLYPYEFWNFSG